MGVFLIPHTILTRRIFSVSANAIQRGVTDDTGIVENLLKSLPFEYFSGSRAFESRWTHQEFQGVTVKVVTPFLVKSRWDNSHYFGGIFLSLPPLWGESRFCKESCGARWFYGQSSVTSFFCLLVLLACSFLKEKTFLPYRFFRKTIGKKGQIKSPRAGIFAGEHHLSCLCKVPG